MDLTKYFVNRVQRKGAGDVIGRALTMVIHPQHTPMIDLFNPSGLSVKKCGGS